jgi:hypothetical protein
MKAIPNPTLRDAALQNLTVIRNGVKLALADSIHIAFVIGLGALLVALALTFFIREIPLRKTTAAQDRAQARAEAVGAT